MLLAILLLPLHDAAAATEKQFAKCQKMLDKNATWLEARADKARHGFDKKVQAMISDTASNGPDPELERARLSALVDALIAQSSQDAHQEALIDKPAADVRKVENGPGLVCWPASSVKTLFKSNLDRYRANLDDIETEIRDRLGIESLGPDEGLVAILFYAQGAAQEVRINRLKAIGGGITFGPIRNGDFFRVLKVKAGTYRWHLIQNRYGWGAYNMYLKGSKNDFVVEAGKLNYTGAFTYEADSSWRYQTRVADRVSVVLSLIENRYPGLLDEVPFNNGLDSDNRFIEFYMHEKMARRNEDDGA